MEVMYQSWQWCALFECLVALPAYLCMCRVAQQKGQILSWATIRI